MDSRTPQQAYDQIAFYTLAHPDPGFIHQYAVDAFAAQFADEHDKPIKVAFALAGLYLHLERGYTGREVQLAHMRLAKERKEWPRFSLPAERGSVTPFDVLRAEPGPERDRAIRAWSASVWEAWKDSHARVAAWIHAELGV
ncbi:MAG TPA: DUF5946 family protein [Anaerolineaceae bacterium]|nr:DUF5946 family protein [Anaerolineaceae bacterium]